MVAVPKRRRWIGKVFIATSIDGYIARADGDIEWLTEGATASGHAPAAVRVPAGMDYDSHMGSVDHLVMGRKTYDKVCTFDFWPYPDHRVWVLSQNPHEALREDDRVSVVGSVTEAVSALNTANARGVYVDGGKVVQAFYAAGLIDEWVITRVPIILGSGLPLFATLPHSTRLVHLDSIAAAGGMVTSHYRVCNDHSCGSIEEYDDDRNA
ncbi:MAG: dihydrofolate reductase [Neisseriaceae bacterium]|nr:dihydrofolate reductase [Neisseriaceae bacterium]MBP6860851.1 dihydrofolate reductase [Neisseriaceae bacterium]